MNLKDHTILVITGKAGAGKDILANMVREYIYGTKPNNGLRDFKFSAPLKEAFCGIFGWDLTKIDNLEYKQEKLDRPFYIEDAAFPSELWTRREIMQYLGTDVFRAGDPDVWIHAAMHRAHVAVPYADGFISTDCRFPNELQALRDNFGRVVTLDLRKLNGAQLDGRAAMHASEQGPYGNDESYERTFVEAGDMEALRRRARALALKAFPNLCLDMENPS